MRFDYRIAARHRPSPADGMVIGAVRCSDFRLEELLDGRAVAGVNVQDVQSVTLRTGFLARHPLVQSCFGALWGAVSIPFVLTLQTGELPAEWGFFSLGGLIVALFIVWDALRRGYYLDVFTTGGREKLVAGKLSHVEAEALRAILRSRFSAQFTH